MQAKTVAFGSGIKPIQERVSRSSDAPSSRTKTSLKNLELTKAVMQGPQSARTSDSKQEG